MKYTVTKLGEGNESADSILGNYLTELKLRHHTPTKAKSMMDIQPGLFQLPQAEKDD